MPDAATTMPALRWKIHWPMTLVMLLVLPLLLGLGRWQLLRAEEKRITQAAFEQARDTAPLDIAQLKEEPAQYSRVQMKGRFDNAHNFLLDNRILHGRFGYEVLTPFLPYSTGMAVLVNRGWVEGDPARLQRPVIAAVEGEVALTGSIYRDTARFHFVDNSNENQWPKVIQNLDMDDLQEKLGSPIAPFTVRIDATSPAALRAEWQMPGDNFGPERHIGYAVTWFTLAGVLVVIWFVANTNFAQLLKRNSHGNE